MSAWTLCRSWFPTSCIWGHFMYYKILLDVYSRYRKNYATLSKYLFLLQTQTSCFSSSFSVFARSPLSLPQTPCSRSLRSTICNPRHPHPMRTLRITNGGPERVKKKTEFGAKRERGNRANSEYPFRVRIKKITNVICLFLRDTPINNHI